MMTLYFLAVDLCLVLFIHLSYIDRKIVKAIDGVCDYKKDNIYTDSIDDMFSLIDIKKAFKITSWRYKDFVDAELLDKIKEYL